MNRVSAWIDGSFMFQMNHVSAWIDGSFVYGRSQVWVNCLRAFKNGKLATGADNAGYPAMNRMGLPLHSYPDPKKKATMKLSDMWSKYL